MASQLFLPGQAAQQNVTTLEELIRWHELAPKRAEELAELKRSGELSGLKLSESKRQIRLRDELETQLRTHTGDPTEKAKFIIDFYRSKGEHKIADEAAASLAELDVKESEAIKNRGMGLYYSGGASAGGQSVGLGTVELVSPDGKQTILAQTTRTGQLLRTGTGEVIEPESIKGWTKRHFLAPYMHITPQSTIGTVNREELARRGMGTLVGEIPDARVAESKRPVTDEARKIIGTFGTRTGTVSEIDPQTEDFYLGGLSTAELNTRNSLINAKRQIETILEITKRRPDLIGQWDYLWEGKIKRGTGMQSDSDANALYGNLTQFAEELIRIKEGAVVPPEMYKRLQGIVAGRPWTTEQQFADDMKRALDTLDQALKTRNLGPAGQKSKIELLRERYNY